MKTTVKVRQKMKRGDELEMSWGGCAVGRIADCD